MTAAYVTDEVLLDPRIQRWVAMHPPLPAGAARDVCFGF